MMFEARRFSTRGRGPAALALAPFLLALAVAAGPNPAAAQEWPAVNVYHSPQDLGDDPRSETCPPGCRCDGDGGTGNVLVWDFGSSLGVGVAADLTAMGNTVTTSAVLPADLSPFDVIWHIGFTEWALEEISRVTAFIAAGGGAHLTGENTGCCEAGNDSVEAVVNAVIDGFTVTVGEQGFPFGPYNFNSGALGGITTTPNVLTTWNPGTPGGLNATPNDETILDNILVEGTAEEDNPTVGGVAGPSDMLTGVGRIVVLMDVDWLDYASRTPIVQNIQTFLIAGAGNGPTLDCVIKGTENEEIHLWIDGGPDPDPRPEDEEGVICMQGDEGNTGDYLCGADILIEITRGDGKFTHFRPWIDTLVHHPVCQGETDEGGFCPLPLEPETKRIRMNFRRGAGSPPLIPRPVADVLVDSRGSEVGAPTTIVVSGVAAASANLQRRLIAAGEAEVIAEGPVGAQEPCELKCDFGGSEGADVPDGSVGLVDFNVLGSHWGQAVPACTLGDCDCNGGVGLADFNLLNEEWGQTCPQ